MKITIKEGEYEFSYESNVEHPDVEDAVFLLATYSARYILFNKSDKVWRMS